MIKKYSTRSGILLIGITVFSITLFEYRDLPKLFYLNDEWLQYGAVITNGIFTGLQKYSLLELILGKGRPLGTIIENIIMWLFPLQALPFAILAYISHTASGVLTYILVLRLTKRKLAALIAALFFVSSGISFQAYAWLASTVQAGLCTLCMIGALLLFQRFVESREKKFLLYSLLVLYVSFLIKDSSIILLLFYPLQYFLQRPGEFCWSIVKKYWYILVSVFILGVYKISVFPSGISRWVMYVVNESFYPVVSLSHFIIPYRFMYRAADWFGTNVYQFYTLREFSGHQFPIATNAISDVLSVFMSSFIICACIIMYFTLPKIRKPMLLFVYLYGILFLPIAVFLDRRNVSYVESRYMYMLNVPIAGLLGTAVAVLYDRLNATNRTVKILFFIPGSVLLLYFFYKQTTINRREIFDYVLQGQSLQKVMANIPKARPTIPDRPIFFIDGKRDYYYEQLKAPFQLGPGYMFALMYYKTGKIDKEFISSGYLWQLKREGYKELNGKGLGYFLTKKSLIDAFKQDPSLTISQIVALYNDDGSITDISEMIQNDVAVARRE